MHEARKSQNRDLRADPAWSINSRKMNSTVELRPEQFSGLRRLKAEASSSTLKGSQILFSPGIRTFHWSESCLLTNLVNSRLPLYCGPFLTSCEAMEFAETGHRQEEYPDAPVSSLLLLLFDPRKWGQSSSIGVSRQWVSDE